MEEIEVIERYIVLLLGAKPDRPVPTPTHLQKEIFLLSKANPKMEKYICYMKHRFGPYSADLDEISKNPVIHSNAYFIDKYGHYHLTEAGEKLFKKIINEFQDREKIIQFVSLIKLVREIYDSLNTEELLFLIYTTYPEYTEKSDKAKELLRSPNKEKMALKLLDKGKLTKDKYNEILGRNYLC